MILMSRLTVLAGGVVVFPLLLAACGRGNEVVSSIPDRVPVDRTVASAAFFEAPKAPLPDRAIAALTEGERNPPNFPKIATPELIQISLKALEKNGADLSKPMPSKHTVICEDEDVASGVATWASEAGFSPGAPEEFHLHGGIPRYAVELVTVSVPDVSLIHEQGKSVFNGMADIEGAYYHTWMGEVIR